MLSERKYAEFTELLRGELIPAMGCTEPVSVALCAAKAVQALGEPFIKLRVGCSANIIKNVKSVIIPNTGGLKGIKAAALTGAIAGDPDKGMEVISAISDEAREEIALAHGNPDNCAVYHLKSPHLLHVLVEAIGANHTAEAEIRDRHSNICYVAKDGEAMLDIRADGDPLSEDGEAPIIPSLESVLTYANTVPLDTIIPILKPQVEYNLHIAEEGMRTGYGLRYGEALLNGDGPLDRVRAFTAAASEARMDGCPLPVIINSGSGNQGIATSVPVIVYCRENGISEEQMYRGLVFANLLTIYQKSYIGRLSAFCGAVSATCAAAAAITYLEGGTLEQIEGTICNALAITSGIVCDGAKQSCAAKISAGLNAALMSHQLSMDGRTYDEGNGLVCRGADETIRAVGRMARKGMIETDRQIIEIMLANERLQA